MDGYFGRCVVDLIYGWMCRYLGGFMVGVWMDVLIFGWWLVEFLDGLFGRWLVVGWIYEKVYLYVFCRYIDRCVGKWVLVV